MKQNTHTRARAFDGRDKKKRRREMKQQWWFVQNRFLLLRSIIKQCYFFLSLFHFILFFKRVNFVLPSLFHCIHHACSHFNSPLLSLFRGRIPILYYDAFARSFSILLLVISHCTIFLKWYEWWTKTKKQHILKIVELVDEEEEEKKTATSTDIEIIVPIAANNNNNIGNIEKKKNTKFQNNSHIWWHEVCSRYVLYILRMNSVIYLFSFSNAMANASWLEHWI